MRRSLTSLLKEIRSTLVQRASSSSSSAQLHPPREDQLHFSRSRENESKQQEGGSGGREGKEKEKGKKKLRGKGRRIEVQAQGSNGKRAVAAAFIPSATATSLHCTALPMGERRERANQMQRG